MIFVLIASLFVILCILYIVHRQDILYPSVILCIVYLISIAFALYSWELWDMKHYSAEAMGMVLLGVGVFALVGVYVEKLMFAGKPLMIGEATEESGLKEIRIGSAFMLFDILFCAAVLLWFYLEMRRIAGTGGNWTLMMNAYRSRSSYGILSAEEQMPFLLRQLAKLVNVQGYFFSYVIVNNVIVRRFKARDIRLCIPIAAMAAYTILNAGRLELLKLAACILVCSYILWHRQHGWDRTLSGKYVRVGIVSLFAMVIVFSALRGLVGRTDTRDPLSYMSLYAGGPVRLFDLYLQQPPLPSGIWGQETFYSIMQTIGKLGNDNLRYIKHLEFRSMHNVSLGNVYSALRRYHHDFGVHGIVILTAVFSFCMHYLYCKIKYADNRKADFRTLFYGMVFFVVPMFPIDDHFYSSLLSVAYLANTILLYALYLALIKKVRWLQPYKAVSSYRYDPPRTGAL